MRRCIIDAAQIRANTRVVRTLAGEAAVYAVLKADGYGLGLLPMARTLAEEGIDRFAVTEPGEALAILEAGLPAADILLLRPVPPERIPPLLKTGTVTFSVGTPEEAVALARAGMALGRRPRAHIQVDTGLGRYGFRWDEPMRLRFLYESFTAVRFTGIYTHFAGRDRGIRRQFARFQRVLSGLESAGIDPGLRHCCASTALLRHPEMALDAVRVGSALVGRVPGGTAYGLRSACRIEATVEAVRRLRPGDTVGYGARFRARRDMRVAVVDIGVLHGLGAQAPCGKQRFTAGMEELLRAAWHLVRGGGPTARIGGRLAPVLGRVCTECAILDVTDIDCVPGDKATFDLNPMFCRSMETVWLPAEERPAAAPFFPAAG